MKENRHGFRRFMAVLLCIMLVAGSLGLTTAAYGSASDAVGADGLSNGENVSDDTSNVNTSTGNASIDDTSTGDTSTGDTSTGDTSIDDTSIDDTSGDKTEDPAGDTESASEEDPKTAASDQSEDSANRGSTVTNGGEITDWAQLQAAISEGGEITLTQDIAPGESDKPLSVPADTTVTLNLNGHTLGTSGDSRFFLSISDDSDYGCFIEIQAGGTLILNGDGTISGSDGEGIIVSRNGHFIMNGGTITGISRDGVYAEGSFTMNGGTILEVGRESVYMVESRFEMNGGVITDCHNDGVFIASNSVFTMNGGEISGCQRYGVYESGSTFIMNGGSITGCKSYGVYLPWNIFLYNDFRMYGGTISGNSSYGVHAYYDITLSGGVITDNIYLNHSIIRIKSELSDETVYHVDMSNPGVMTSGLKGKGTAANFAGASEGWSVILNDKGEAVLVRTDSIAAYIERSWSGGQVVSEEKLLYGDNSWSPFPESTSVQEGWYYVNRDITVKDRVFLTGDTHLILGDNHTLNVKGLYVPQGSTLTIYAQSDGENAGKIVSEPSGGAGIGGNSGNDNGNIVIHGGTIVATGADHCAGIGSNDGHAGGDITIYGGTVTAVGGSDGAGIGGGRNCSGGTITIYGGDITANGPTDSDCSENGAGIGGGNSGDGGTIVIYGGTVTTYSRDGAGIGGGDDGDGGTITINGGSITSTKVNQGQGARIGGGCDAAPGTIIINGGSITTVGGSGAGIGGGKRNVSGGSVTISGGVIKTGGDYGIGSGEGGSDVTVTLSYTDATEDSINITSSSYNGTVTLDKCFQKVAGSNGTCVALFNEGTVSDNSQLVGDTLKAWDGSISSWQVLQLLINQAGDGETIQLVQDITAIYGIDFALKVSGNKNIILDLNGYSLDRGLANYGTQPQGNVIQNEGILTIRDSSADHTGTITGGNNADNGGGIVNMGMLTLEGGTISGNTSAERGGGIMNEGGAVLNLAGGTITGNTAVSIYGGGIYNMSKMNISGSPVVSGNTAADGDNVFLSSYGSAMKVVGELDQGCQLGVTQGFTGAFTSGLSDKGTAANFFSDDDRYAVSIHDDGEAWLDTAVTVTFDSDGGSEVEAQTVAAGQKAERPEDPTKDGFSFKDWYQVTDAEAGTLADTAFDFENTAVTEDITLKAVWEENAEETVIIKNANVEFSGKIRLKFAFIFPESVLADEGAYVTFEKAGTTTKKLVSEGTADGDAISFIIPVPAPEFADDIVVRVFDGEDSQLTLKTVNGTDYTENGFVYSVKTYAQNKSQSGSTEEMRALAKALFDYGTAAQIYFEYGDFEGLSVDGAVLAVTEDDLAPYALTVTGTKPQGVTSAGIMVEFDTDNTLRITFKTDGSKLVGSYTFLLDGTEKKATKKGKNAYLQIKNIAAPNLDTVHTFSVTDGTDTYTITACALSYAYTSVQNGDSNRQNLGKALYLYNRAADAYFGG